MNTFEAAWPEFIWPSRAGRTNILWMKKGTYCKIADKEKEMPFLLFFCRTSTYKPCMSKHHYLATICRYVLII